MKYLAAIVVLLGVPLLGSAQSPVVTVVVEEEGLDDIVINEFLPNPVGADTEGEFIELKNMGEEEVDLGEWELDDGDDVSAAYVIPSGALVAGGQVVLFWRSETKITLNNKGDEVRLSGPDKKLRDSVVYTEPVAEGVVRAREEAGVWQWSTTATPGEENIITGVAEEVKDAEDDQQYSDDIIINEFLPNPVGADTEGEFIELKNVGEVEVSLGDWQLDDEEGGSSAYNVPEGMVLGKGETAVFWRSATGLALNNDGDAVRLFSPNGEVKDEHSYAAVVAEGMARARDAEGVWQWSTTSTAGEENIITGVEEEGEDKDLDEREYSDDIVINEFLPNPVGADTEGEFIELKNIGGEEIDLEGWELDDGDGGSSKYDMPTGERIAAGELKVFWRAETKLALNNGGDAVRLFSPNGQEKSSFVYEESVGEGVSYNRQSDGDYVLSTTVTPGEENIITKLEEEGGKGGVVAGATAAKILLKDVRQQKLGAMVEVEGIVSAPPGVFGDKIMYLAGSGIQVYFYGEEYPELEVGDKVRVRGELAMSLGEYRIKLAAAEDVVVIGEEVAPEPHVVATGEVGEALEGSLVAVAGRVTRTSGDTFYVDDGSGEVKVFIKKTAGIEKPKMRKGVGVTIRGVVSRTNAGYRILPRWQQDVWLGLGAGLARFPGAGWLYPSFGVAILLAGVMLVGGQRAGEPLFMIS